jgi:6-phosphogluconolactonase
MKLRKFGQVSLAIVLSLSSSLLITACSNTQAIDFVFVTNSKSVPGKILVYKADTHTGALIQISQPTYDSGGTNPVAEVVSPNNDNLYVVNRDSNDIVHFSIASSGQLTSQDTVKTPGLFPVGVAISPSGNFLYVTDTCVAGATDITTCPGAVVVFPLGADGAIGPAIASYQVGFTPIGVSALANGTAVYVVSKGGDTQLGRVYAFSTKTDGSLAPIGSGWVAAGVSPNAVVTDPTSRFLYATDGAANQLIGYSISSAGALTPMINGPFKTDLLPDGVTMDPRGYYIYVANYNSATVNSYAIDLGSGSPSQVAGSGSTKTGPAPTCVVVEPALGRYVYVSSFTDNTVSAFQLNPHDGTLIAVQNQPFPGGGQPTCVAAVPHGNHAIQAVGP